MQRFHDQVAAFVEQRDDLLLLIACSADDTALALKCLRDLDRASPGHVFLLFADDFCDADSFVAATVARVTEEHRVACEWAAAERRPLLPPVPSSLLNTNLPTEVRFRQLIEFARTLAPIESGHRLVWAMIPARITDPAAYRSLLLKTLGPEGGIQPWMRGLRLILRVESADELLRSPLCDLPRTRRQTLDFGPPALAASMEEEAHDTTLPEADRMQALLMLALLDGAHGRAAAAREKYSLLYEYFHRTENRMLEAVVLNGLGDLPHRTGDLAEARHWYECAVPAAVAAEQPIMLAMVVQNLAAVAFQSGDFGQAEEYYRQLVELKAMQLDEDGQAEALEWRGLCQERLRQLNAAVASWEHAELVSRAFDLPHRLRPVLEHLARVYRELGAAENTERVSTALAGLRA